jgi:hypothetical protein
VEFEVEEELIVVVEIKICDMEAPGNSSKGWSEKFLRFGLKKVTFWAIQTSKRLIRTRVIT